MIVVAVGANLPAPDGTPPLEACRRAALALDGVCGLALTAVSGWYETAPVPPSGQPNYINGVVALAGTADPAALLTALQSLEDSGGRHRGAPNAARTLDLDIIAIDDMVRSRPDPILPHPRMHERSFVLAPLLDVAPDWRHPILNKTAIELLAALPIRGVKSVSPPSHLRDRPGALS